MKWRRLGRCVFFSGIVVVIAVVAYCLARTPNFDALKTQGDSVVLQIEAYRTAHGQYPQSLHEVHIKAPFTFFGRWHYSRFDSNYFELSVGKYRRDDFEFHYRSNNGWYVDQ
jgi:hypothetical protein